MISWGFDSLSGHHQAIDDEAAVPDHSRAMTAAACQQSRKMVKGIRIRSVFVTKNCVKWLSV